jgi:hypothetical protein
VEHICLVIPVLEGEADDARDFMRELEQTRKGDCDQTECRLADSTGVDLNDPLQMTLPELLSSDDAKEMATA